VPSVIPVLSTADLAAALLALRHGAPARPALAARWPGCCRPGWRNALPPRTASTISPLFVATW